MNSMLPQDEPFELNYERFGEKLKDELKKSLPDKNPKYIDLFVDELIKGEIKFISKKTVEEYSGFCEKCGTCCEECPELKGQLCGIHSRMPNACKLWPYWEAPLTGDYGIQPAMGCPYAFKVVFYEALKILKKI